MHFIQLVYISKNLDALDILFCNRIILLDSKTIIHGLEQLIEHYQEDVNGLVVQLSKNYAANEPPPHYSRRNGRTNLLHRATKEGNSSKATLLQDALIITLCLNRKLSRGFGAAEMRLP